MATYSFSYADLLARNAVVHRQQAALTGDFGTLTHAQLAERAVSLAESLRARGIAPGDRVAVLAANRPEIMDLLGACAHLGAVLVLLNTRASSVEIASVLADSGASMVVVEAALEPLLEHVPASLVRQVFGHAGALRNMPGEEQAMLRRPLAHDAHHPLVAIPTAAVDGRPRLALLSSAALVQQALQLAHAWSLTPTDRHLCILPLFHMAGLGLTLAVQLAGGASVLMSRFDADAAARAISSSRVSCFASFAPILGAILDAGEAGGHDLGSLRAVTGLESPEVTARLQQRWPSAVFWSGYGQTETGGLVSLAPARECAGGAGRPLPTVAIRIETEQGCEAATGETGEILVRGPCVFSGYWNRPAETAHASRGGWHHTGDLGRMDDSGFLWFKGRAPEKALIKSGGENIYPAEVEHALRAHPAVLDAVVIGVPDARWGEAVRAICVLQPGHLATQEELAAFVGERIARFKRPREVLFVDSMPLNADGRPDRAAIAAAYCTPSVDTAQL